MIRNCSSPKVEKAKIADPFRAEELNKKQIVLEILTGIAVGDIDGAFERRTEQNPNNTLASVLGYSVAVVDDAEQYQRMNHHLLDRSR